MTAGIWVALSADLTWVWSLRARSRLVRSGRAQEDCLELSEHSVAGDNQWRDEMLVADWLLHSLCLCFGRNTSVIPSRLYCCTGKFFDRFR